MSVTISSMQTVDIPDDTPVAKYNIDTMEVMVYPAGLGTGPMMLMKLSDWTILNDRVNAAVKAAIAQAVGP